MTLSNDSMEGKILAETFARIFEKDSLDAEVSTRLRETLGALEEMLDGLAFCLSSDGDLLSQWRGYALDGEGFSIGFSKQYLEALADAKKRKMEDFRLHEVIYDPSKQEAAMRPVYEEVKKDIDAGKLKRPSAPGLLSMAADIDAEVKYEAQRLAFIAAHEDVNKKLAKTFRNLYTLKNVAFCEEKEWRLISFLTRTDQDSCLYRVSSNRITPYRSYELLPLEFPEVIEVILGPKNQTPEYIIQKMLAQHEFSGVTVRRSKVTYR